MRAPPSCSIHNVTQKSMKLTFLELKLSVRVHAHTVVIDFEISIEHFDSTSRSFNAFFGMRLAVSDSREDYAEHRFSLFVHFVQEFIAFLAAVFAPGSGLGHKSMWTV